MTEIALRINTWLAGRGSWWMVGRASRFIWIHTSLIASPGENDITVRYDVYGIGYWVLIKETPIAIR